jgi:hypothetical protein
MRDDEIKRPIDIQTCRRVSAEARRKEKEHSGVVDHSLVEENRGVLYNVRAPIRPPFGVTQIVDGNWGVHTIIRYDIFAGADPVQPRSRRRRFGGKTGRDMAMHWVGIGSKPVYQ